MAPEPRLLILTPDFPPARGGIQTVADRLAAGIEGFDKRVIALGAPGAESFDREREIAVRRVGASRMSQRERNALLNAVSLADALRFRPDITLSMHMVTSPAAAAIRRATGAPTVQYFYAEEIGARPRLAAFAARRADDVIALSTYTASLIDDVGVVPRSLVLIPPGVDIPGDATPQAIDRPTVLTIARMQERYKGHDVLVRALVLVRAKVPDVQWIVIGDGPLRAGVEALARTHGVSDSIRFLGAVSDEERNSWLRRSHLLAMPSRLPGDGYAGEGFGIVYLEAGTYAKPVVAGGVGGALDAVGDRETGLLVDPLDQLALAEAITELLLDPALAERLGAAGQARAQALAWPAIVRRVEAVLRERLARSSAETGAPGASPTTPA